MTDRALDAGHLRSLWRSFAHRIAVAGGSLVALISLLHHVPLSTACLRGGAAFVAVRLVARAGLFALERALASAPAERAGEGRTPR